MGAPGRLTASAPRALYALLVLTGRVGALGTSIHWTASALYVHVPLALTGQGDALAPLTASALCVPHVLLVLTGQVGAKGPLTLFARYVHTNLC